MLKDISGIKLSDLQDPLSAKIRGRFRKQLIIKFKDVIPRDLGTILKKLGPGWIIDVDPISTI